MNSSNLNSQELKTKNKKINQIIFHAKYDNNIVKITVNKEKLTQWRNVSEFIDVLMSCYHDNEVIDIDLTHIIDLNSLMIIFSFFDTKQVLDVEYNQKIKILNGLSYFGINPEILNSIKKGYGLVWKLHQIDIDINEQENKLKQKIKELSSNPIENNEILKNLDTQILMNKDTYNVLYEKLYENYPTINKLYESINSHKIYPEFDLSFIKQEFEKHSNHIFDDLENCIVTGGMVSKHFTYNSYFIDTDYDVFIFNKSENEALQIIKTLFDRLNSKLKTHIIKTKNTITLYNSKYEVQIITRLYHNISDILTQFDLDSCCVGYSNGKLYALPRFIRSLAYSGNILDPERQSPSYIHRLKKYIKRDFNLYIPGLKKNDPEYNKDNYIMKKLREKTDRFEKDSDYCDHFVLMKNRNNKEIHEVIEYFHKQNKFLDTFEIKNIDDIYDNVNIDWNYQKINNPFIDFYNDMYRSIYIR